MSKFIFLKSLPTILEPIKRLIDRKAQDVDWNENDPASSSYIANRTHYKSTKHVVDLPETSIEFTNNSGMYMGFYVADIPLSEGDTKIVVWDGVSYKCVATPLEGGLALGNAGIFGGENTGEPFLIGVVSGNPVVMITPDTSATHTVGISGESTVIHKIPEEYLPSMDYVSYVDYQDLTSAQMRIARENIGAGTSSFNGNYNSLTNKPTFATVATSGSYNDLTDKPSISNTEIAFVDQVNGYTYIACMRGGSFVTYCGAKSIKVTTMPQKTEYMEGDYLDPTGMIITASLYDGTEREIENYSYMGTYLTEANPFAEVTYEEAGIKHTIAVPVSVSAFDPATVLVDFTYTANSNGTYTITGWNGTLNGVASTELVIPNNHFVQV